MKHTMMLTVVAAVVMAAAPSWAAPKSYQVTGPVQELTPEKIVVQKGGEKWEIARGSATVPETVKVGSKVKVEYSMTATTVEDKDAKPVKTEKPAKTKK